MDPVRGKCMTPRDGVLLFVVWTLLMGLSGCAPLPHPSQEVEPAEPLPAADVMLWEEGMKHFRAGEYDEALVGFDTLKNSARSDRYARMAAYASACMRLTLARSVEEFNEALQLWTAWGERDPLTDSEDPRLLMPLLQRIALTGSPMMHDADSEKPMKSKKRPSYKVELVNRDLAAYKSQVQAKEKESERLKTRLEARDREIRRLKQQIESLEAIHLKFQERQKEISSP